MAYDNSADALRQLLLLRLYGASISRSSGSVSMLTNGMPYFFVELTLEDGSQYGIPAYGHEAIELYEETTMLIRK